MVGLAHRTADGVHSPPAPVPQLKQMEVQLEEEYEDKQKVLRERRELEAKLLNIQDKVVPPLGVPTVWSLYTSLHPHVHTVVCAG